MKTRILLYCLPAVLLALFLCEDTKAQVGIGTATPSSTLDLRSSNPANPGSSDGFLAPRVSAFPATHPGANQNGMLIYLTTANATNPVGFYFWDHPNTTWKPLALGSATPLSGFGDNSLALVSGGSDLNFGDNDWGDGAFSDLILNATTDPTGIYNATTGVFTIKEAGFYLFISLVYLQNTPGAGATFDGHAGHFVASLEVLSVGGGSFQPVSANDILMLRGLNSSTKQLTTVSATVYLKPGDQVKTAFFTTSTSNMNTVLTNIILPRSSCATQVYRL